MNKIEAKWNTIFNAYLRHSDMLGYFELKYTDKDYFSFYKIEKHQLEGLQASEQNGFVWKLSDQDIREKPFDCFSTPPLPSYLVIVFTNTFYCIRIKKIVKMIDEGLNKITLTEAKRIADKIIHI